MNKRRVSFKEDIEIKRFKEGDENFGASPSIEKLKTKFDNRVAYSFKGKHSLDSDEEDEGDLTTMPINDIEGQEDDTVNEYDEIKITPFNMKDEMNEGHFDETGNFIFDKKSEIRDNWIDNIDWVQIKRNTDYVSQPENENSSDSEDEEAKAPINFIDTYKLILTFLKPGESVLRAIKRLGSSKAKSNNSGRFSSSASERLKYKKEQREKERLAKENNQQTEPTTNDIIQPNDEQDLEKGKEHMIKLTELADELLQQGVFDIYDFTYEKLSHLISHNENLRATNESQNSKILSTKAVDENVDMFDTID